MSWPVWVALPLIAAVFAAGGVWSFREQSALAAASEFHVPALLPLTIDGFAVAMAAVAWAASLDGRAAVFARAGVAVGIACSSATNAAWAWTRSAGDLLTVIIAAGIPVLAMVAFEVLLAEVRRQVQRHRGLPQAVPVPWPRLIRLALAPRDTFKTWRQLVIAVTDPRTQFATLEEATWNTTTAASGAGWHSSPTASGSATAANPSLPSSPTPSAPTNGARPAEPGGVGQTPKTRKPSRSPKNRNGSSRGNSPKHSDTELVSLIRANGWTELSLDRLVSSLQSIGAGVSKRRATELRRAAREAPTTSPSSTPSPSTPAPTSSSSSGQPSDPDTAARAVLADVA